ncbi:MAG: ketoacyl-ACP synthase III [Planctomycetes bacterium]|nr:ketoacyl-ACP synthase III [Planctomycetota bacterium]
MARPITNDCVRAAVLGTGRYLPEGTLSNHDLEKLVATSDEWIVTRTGIHNRHIASSGETTSNLAVKASEKACKNAGISPEELDLILVATITPDMFFPSTACLVQDQLGARTVGAFDMLAACSGFVYAITTAASYIESGRARNVLVVGAETLSKVVDYQDRSTCILFGDGAGAVILGADQTGRGVLYSHLAADGSGSDLMKIPARGSACPTTESTVSEKLHYMKINGREVFRFAVHKMVELTQNAMDSCELSPDDVALVIPHQVNERIIESAIKKSQVPRDRYYININRYGNTSAASIPIALDEARQQGRIHSGDNVVLVAFGGGLTWASAVIRM